MIELNQTWPMPEKALPIVIFGAGSIVKDAHLPAYINSGFKVLGLYDPDLEKAKKLAQPYSIKTFLTAKEAADQENVVFDLATPPIAHKEILEILPLNNNEYSGVSTTNLALDFFKLAPCSDILHSKSSVLSVNNLYILINIK